MNTREKKIKKEQQEINKLFKLLGLGEVIDTSENNVYAFSQLEGQKRQLVRMIILDAYLQIDNKMNILITNFFFHHCLDDYEDIQKITTSKEFIVFSEKILNEMPFLRKISTIKSFIAIPKKILTNCHKLNDLRNAIAHSLIPEKLGNDRVLYENKSIFTLKGVQSFNKDIRNVLSFLQKHFIESFKNNRTNSTKPSKAKCLETN